MQYFLGVVIISSILRHLHSFSGSVAKIRFFVTEEVEDGLCEEEKVTFMEEGSLLSPGENA